jgi:uncharacterized protein (TIGR02145 family)
MDEKAKAFGYNCNIIMPKLSFLNVATMENLFRISGVILLTFLIHSCKKNADNAIQDVDGNIYTSVTVGTQIWLVENLKTTKYNDGTSIPNVIDNTEWTNLVTPGYCWYNNDEATYKNPYGALYNWYAVNTGKLCPKGWHVPTDSEWHQLILLFDTSADLTYIESQIAGNNLKESGTTHWNSPNMGTNQSGFTALPGSMRSISGEFGVVGDSGNWWSSTEGSIGYAVYRCMVNYVNYVWRGVYTKWVGTSVRCIKDK